MGHGGFHVLVGSLQIASTLQCVRVQGVASQELGVVAGMRELPQRRLELRVGDVGLVQ
jgi:hypothetical protein